MLKSALVGTKIQTLLSPTFPPYGRWPPSVSPNQAQADYQYPGVPCSCRQQATPARARALAGPLHAAE